MTARRTREAAFAAALAALLLLSLCPAAAAAAFSDISDQPADIQAAIENASAKGYMNGAPDGKFYPNDPMGRLDFACAAVKLFHKQDDSVDPNMHFTDLKASNPRYRFANIAVQNGYLGYFQDGSFRPDEPIPTVNCLAGIAVGLGLTEQATYVAGLYPRGPSYTGYSVIASDLHLKHRDTRAWPSAGYPRGEMAFTLQQAEQFEEWRVEYVKEAFTWRRCQTPLLGTARQKALDAAFSKIGFPYVWGGESDAERGYDCSGLVYYALKSVLGYPMMRVADDQARDGRYASVCREELLAGDPVFFHSDVPATTSSYVGHAGMYVGRGLFIHSTGSNAGVSVDYLTGYWAEHFAWGKRVLSEPPPDSFDTYVLLMNPCGESATATVKYMLADGSVLEEERRLAPYSRSTVRADDALENQEFSTTVTATRGQVIAERSMYFNYRDRFPGGHDSPGVLAPATSWFLAEGCTDWGFDTYVLVQNPGGEPASVRVRFLREDGGTVDRDLTVPPRARQTVWVDTVPGMEKAEFSTAVTSDRPVVVERSMYFDYGGVREGHNAAAVSALSPEWDFAEGYTGGGFDTYVLLANPSDTTASVTVNLLDEKGKSKTVRRRVAPRSRDTVAVDRVSGWESREFSVTVRSDVPIAAERAMYFTYNGITGGHASTGSEALSRTWYLAEGYTAGAFDTYVLLSNPGAEKASVSVRYMLTGGRFIDKKYEVRPHSRYTVAVDGIRGLDRAEVSAFVTSDAAIMVERSVYFKYGNRPGGSCAQGVKQPAPSWYFAEGYTGR